MKKYYNVDPTSSRVGKTFAFEDKSWMLSFANFSSANSLPSRGFSTLA